MRASLNLWILWLSFRMKSLSALCRLNLRCLGLGNNQCSELNRGVGCEMCNLALFGNIRSWSLAGVQVVNLQLEVLEQLKSKRGSEALKATPSTSHTAKQIGLNSSVFIVCLFRSPCLSFRTVISFHRVYLLSLPFLLAPVLFPSSFDGE